MSSLLDIDTSKWLDRYKYIRISIIVDKSITNQISSHTQKSKTTARLQRFVRQTPCRFHTDILKTIKNSVGENLDGLASRLISGRS